MTCDEGEKRMNWVTYGVFVPFSIMLLCMAFSQKLREKVMGVKALAIAEGKLAFWDRWYWLFFVLCLGAGIFVRVYRFCELPKGTNQDGVRGAYESFLLLRNGVDSFGRSWPTYFEAWKYTNMSTLYSWICIPFLHFFGNTVFAMRLPSLIISILMMPVLWDLGRRMRGRNFGLLLLFLVATNPWQMFQSRWAIDANIMPHVFLLAIYFLYVGLTHRVFLYVSMVFFGFSVYAYGLAAFLVPVFLLPMAIYLVSRRKVRIYELIICLAVFAVVSGMYYWTMVINAFGLESVQIGPFTLPYLKDSHRASEIALAQKDGIFAIGNNVRSVFEMLFELNPENAPYDAINWAHAMFRFMPVYYVFGFVWLWSSRRLEVRNNKDTALRTYSVFMMAFTLAAIFTGLQTGVNIMRINYLFYSLVILSGYAIYEMGRRVKLTAVLAVGLIAVNFVFLCADYFGNTAYQNLTGVNFRPGFFSALKDTWGMDYDKIVIGVSSGTEKNMVEPTVQFAHEIDYKALTEQTDLTGADGNPTGWYYTERYVYITDPDSFMPEPMACNVYVMYKDKYADKFNPEEYLIYDYDLFFAAYPKYWAE